ncbi:hypothetical protein SALBM217S_06463 [Streptomyces griseoloalbus]
MAEVLVYVDHVDGAVRKPTLELLTLARRIGEPVAVALGNGAGDTVATLAEHGAVKVLTHEAAEYADYLVVPKVDALQAAHEAVSPAAVLVASSAEGKEIAARLALRIGSGIITDAVDLEAGDEGPVATQSVFAAGYTTKSRVSKGTPVITVKPNSAAVEAAPAAGAVIAVLLAGSLAVQTVMVPLLASDLDGLDEQYAYLRTPLLVIVVLTVLAAQTVLICVWRLVTMARRGTVFSYAAFRYVHIVIGAFVAAALLVFALGALLAPGEAVAPGVVLLVGGIGLAIGGIALVVLVLRMLLAQAVARELEASRMRAELAEVI